MTSVVIVQLDLGCFKLQILHGSSYPLQSIIVHGGVTFAHQDSSL